MLSANILFVHQSVLCAQWTEKVTAEGDRNQGKGVQSPIKMILMQAIPAAENICISVGVLCSATSANYGAFK